MNDDSSSKTVDSDDIDIETPVSKRKPSNNDSSRVPKKKKVTQSSVTETPKGVRPSSAFVTPDTDNAVSVPSNNVIDLIDSDDDDDDDDRQLPAVNLNVRPNNNDANNNDGNVRADNVRAGDVNADDVPADDVDTPTPLIFPRDMMNFVPRYVIRYCWY